MHKFPGQTREETNPERPSNETHRPLVYWRAEWGEEEGKRGIEVREVWRYGGREALQMREEQGGTTCNVSRLVWLVFSRRKQNHLCHTFQSNTKHGDEHMYIHTSRVPKVGLFLLFFFFFERLGILTKLFYFSQKRSQGNVSCDTQCQEQTFQQTTETNYKSPRPLAPREAPCSWAPTGVVLSSQD